MNTTLEAQHQRDGQLQIIESLLTQTQELQAKIVKAGEAGLVTAPAEARVKALLAVVGEIKPTIHEDYREPTTEAPPEPRPSGTPIPQNTGEGASDQADA